MAAEAEAIYRKVVATDRQNFDARSLLGTLLVQTGRLKDGLDMLEAAAKLRPGSPNVQRNIGIVRLQMNDAAGAESAFSAALRARPDDIDALRGKARALSQLRRLPDAEKCLRRIVALTPASASDLTDLGGLLAQLEKYRDALEILAVAARLQPKSAVIHVHAGRCFRGLHEPDKALDPLETAMALDPRDIAIRLALAEVRRDLNQSAVALDIVDAGLAIAPGNTVCQALKASLLLDLGRRDEALGLYRELALIPRHRASALLELAQSKTLGETDPDATLILDAPSEGMTQVDQAILAFARGKCLEDLSRHGEAFENYAKARKLRGATISGRAPTGPEIIFRAFETSQFEVSHGSDSEVPVFIVGMPRSGTSLVEQIIGSHAHAAGAGEMYDLLHLGQELGLLQGDPAALRDAFRKIDGNTAEKLAARYLHALRRGRPDALRIADKMPHNFMMLGLIAKLFPKARIIHVTREPADTCISCFANNLSDYHRYANDLGSLGRYYASYDKLMRHWRDILPLAIHDIGYETLVAEPERESRKLIDVLGLDWDAACLRFFEQGRTVTTFSRGQVRQPIYNRSIGRWRKFEPYLGPLFEGLGDLAPEAKKSKSG